MPRMSESEYNAKQLNTVLKGAGFIRAFVAEDEDDMLILEFARKIGGEVTSFELAVQRDPEGNGPGWIECGHVLEAIEAAK